MIQDLHCHTYYSFCGHDSPEAVVETAIAGNIRLLGITDHNYGIGFGTRDAFAAHAGVLPQQYAPGMLERYCSHISLLKEKYADRITLLCGIEIATTSRGLHWNLPVNTDVSHLDYCLVEHLNADLSQTTVSDLFAFAGRLGCGAVGVAHTDMFAYIRGIGEDPRQYFKKMAENNIFWEMNVNYDSVHSYREHAYVAEFFKSPEQQQIVRESGVRLSVGFDGHLTADYRPDRIAACCEKITEMGIKLAFAE